MIQYEIMSEQEAMAERFQLMSEGVYEGIVTSSEDRVSSGGNSMMDMIITVYDHNGIPHEVRDFLIFTKKMMWKVIHFCDSAGLLNEYTSGKLCSMVALNRRVMVKIVVEEGKQIPENKLNGKPSGAKYFDKNKVEDYVKRSDQSVQNNVSVNNSSQLAEDDILPF